MVSETMAAGRAVRVEFEPAMQCIGVSDVVCDRYREGILLSIFYRSNKVSRAARFELGCP